MEKSDTSNQYDLEFRVLAKLQKNEPKLARIFKTNFTKQLTHYFDDIEEFYEIFKKQEQLHTMVHFSKFNSAIELNNQEWNKNVKSQLGRILDFIELGSDSISRNYNDVNYFDQSNILDLWK
jgi:hypothetical protein